MLIFFICMAKLKQVPDLIQWIFVTWKTFSYCQLFFHIHKSPPPHEIPSPPVITNHIRAITRYGCFTVVTTSIKSWLFDKNHRVHGCKLFLLHSHRLARTRMKGVSDSSDSVFLEWHICHILHLQHIRAQYSFLSKSCRKCRKWFPFFTWDVEEISEKLPPP